MIKIFGFISRISLVAIIFFSLQGEVIVRYGEILHGKTKCDTATVKNTAERQRLIKLQCFTQKFRAVMLPAGGLFVFKAQLAIVEKPQRHRFNVAVNQFRLSNLSLLRGPPIFA